MKVLKLQATPAQSAAVLGRPWASDALSALLLFHVELASGAAMIAKSDGACNAVGHLDVHHDDEQQLQEMLILLQASPLPLPLLIPLQLQMQSLMVHAASQLPNQRSRTR